MSKKVCLCVLLNALTYEFFLVRSYVCVKNFYEDPFSSFYIKLLRDRQTDRQMLGEHNLLGLGGDKKSVSVFCSRSYAFN